jgi:beta-xylosidase
MGARSGMAPGRDWRLTMKKPRRRMATPAAAVLLGVFMMQTDRIVADEVGAYVSPVWVSDQGDGTYRNPILHADYSDPDVCRVGADYFMTASSFNCVPGLPILHSRDLVNWRLIGHALDRLEPEDVFAAPQHGNGVWAPSIRHHDGNFYIYWGDPDYGIYMVRAEAASGPWSRPVLVKEARGYIDPSPLWDDDGRAYLSHALAGSRAGLKSVLLVARMAPDGARTIGEHRIVYDGHDAHRTVEGTKFYKRDGWYYIFAPAGGVTTGWQLVLRSRDPFGPYEEQVVLAQGNTDINGPHQGAWVETEHGEHWFIHFQDAGAYGRITHLQPMQWLESGFPVMGIDPDGDGTGEPVRAHAKPAVGGSPPPIQTPAENDAFSTNTLGLQWQWHANPSPKWSFADAREEVLRLYCRPMPDDAQNLWSVPNLLLQKFTAPAFTATVRFEFRPSVAGERAGCLVMGEDYAYLALEETDAGRFLVRATCVDAPSGAPEQIQVRIPFPEDALYVRLTVAPGAACQFAYSRDGTAFVDIGPVHQATPGRWIGAKLGFFGTSARPSNDSGWLDVDWYRLSR